MPSEIIEPVLDEASTTVAAWLGQFERALAGGDGAAVAALFEPGGFWRDIVCFTWNISTAEGQDAITAMLDAQLPHVRPSGWRLAEPAAAEDGVVSAIIAFETTAARGRGHVRLRGGRCWTLLTEAIELKGFAERSGRNRALGTAHGVQRGRQSWAERRAAEQLALGRTEQPYCVIVGAGQGGLALGARLRRLDVPTLIVDAHARPGDQWRSRYKSLCLHDPVWYDHLPYLPFPDDWPVFAPKDKIGDWLEMYAKVMELNLWCSTTCESARFDDATHTWEVVVDHNGERVTLRPTQLVLATGMSGVPNVPTIPGSERFRGEQHHSSRHPGGDAWRGKRAVVIGSNNSAHDIAADLWENGADVTMVQRSSTHVSRSESLTELSTAKLYSEDALERGIDTEKADLLNASVPYRLMHEFMKPVTDQIRARDAAFYRRLTASGFLLDFGDDDSGLFMKYVRRGSGYYIDVGASELIADGKIKLKQGAVREITEDGVMLGDGTTLPADLIVYATGYGNMNGWAAKLISPEVADTVGACWGLGSDTTKDPGPWEGELRNMWKPTRQQGLWFHGGNLHQSRHYSRALAIQLKARLEGIATPVWGMPAVHHTH